VCRHCDTPTLFRLSHTAKEPRLHAHKVIFLERHSWFIIQPRVFIQSWRNVVHAPVQPSSVTAPCPLAASHVTRIRIGGAPFDLSNDRDKEIFPDMAMWKRRIILSMHQGKYGMASELWLIVQQFPGRCQIYLLIGSFGREILWKVFPEEKRLTQAHSIPHDYVDLPSFTGPVSRFICLVYEPSFSSVAIRK
jgi:hypothetical protein